VLSLWLVDVSSVERCDYDYEWRIGKVGKEYGHGTMAAINNKT